MKKITLCSLLLASTVSVASEPAFVISTSYHGEEYEAWHTGVTTLAYSTICQMEPSREWNVIDKVKGAQLELRTRGTIGKNQHTNVGFVVITKNTKVLQEFVPKANGLYIDWLSNNDDEQIYSYNGNLLSSYFRINHTSGVGVLFTEENNFTSPKYFLHGCKKIVRKDVPNYRLSKVR